MEVDSIGRQLQVEWKKNSVRFNLFLYYLLWSRLRPCCKMYGFVDDTKLEDCSLIKEEENKISFLGI